MSRRFVALDLETTTLDRRFAVPLEVAAVEFAPAAGKADIAEVERFVPYHTDAVLHGADPDALAVNRYYERRLFADMLDPAATAKAADRLVDLLTDAVLVCANPSYDSIILWSWLATIRPDLGREPWHFRHYDVSLATAVEFGLDRIPGLRESAEMWQVSTPAPDWHTAAYDALTTAEVCSAVQHSAATRSGR